MTMAKSGAATTGAGQQRFESSIQQSLSPLIAGLAGGSVSTITLYPLDLVKVRQQVHDEVGSKGARKRLTFFQAVRGVVRHEGLIGLYQGLTPAVVGSAVSWGGYVFVYEGLKHRYAAHKFPHDPDPRNLSGSDNFLLATCSGVVMVAMTNPVWLIKTRMQLQMNKTSTEHSIKPYKNMADAARTIVRDEGMTALYKGAGPALLLTSHGGVQFVAYEYLKKRFHFERARRDSTESVLERLQKSLGYLTIGGISKM